MRESHKRELEECISKETSKRDAAIEEVANANKAAVEEALIKHREALA